MRGDGTAVEEDDTTLDGIELTVTGLCETGQDATEQAFGRWSPKPPGVPGTAKAF